MRVCPKCGHEDPLYWRHSKYSYWIDQTEYENFEIMHPNLCPLQRGGLTEDDTFVYRRMKRSGRVERKAKLDYEVYGWYEDMEIKNYDAHDFRKYWERKPKLSDFIETSTREKT